MKNKKHFRQIFIQSMFFLTLMSGFVFFYIIPSNAFAAVLFSDDFESGYNWIASNANFAGVSNQTSNSPSNSMFTRGGVVTTTSPVIDASGATTLQIEVWIRKGDDGFSENPEGGDNLEFGYINNVGTFVILETFIGGGTQGEIFTRTYNIAASDAYHANFQVRARQTNGSGGPPANGGIGWDYWHIDDVIVNDLEPIPLAYGTCDDFERGFGNWTAAGTGDASIGSETFNSASNSMRLRWNAVTATSIVIDMNQPVGILEVWIRRGDNSFSNRPEGNENLTIQYLNNSSTWITLETFTGGGAQGEIFNRSYTLPADALHSNFQIRFSFAGGNGPDFDYWHVDDVCLIDPLAGAYFMDESIWDGTPNEVVDSSSNSLHGTAVNGATTAVVDPAIAGSPGTCRYGTFDGIDDYVQVNNLSSILNGTASLAFWINTTQTGNNSGWMAPGVTGVEESGGADDIFWGWIDASGNIGISVGNDFAADQKSTTAINDGNWHHVVLTRDIATGNTLVYVDGVLEQTGTTGAGTIGNTYSSIGRIEDTGGSPEYFNGQLDEVRIYDRVLNTAEANRVMNLTRPCLLVHHYAISHSGSGVTCDASVITITAHDITDTPIDVPGGTTLAISAVDAADGVTLAGQFANAVGGGSLSGTGNPVTYTWPSSPEENFFTIELSQLTPLTININASDGSATDKGDNTDPEDQDIVFSDAIFRVTESPVTVPVPEATITTKISGKPSNSTGFGQQTLYLQAIRTDDESGSCVGAFQNQTATIEMAGECNNPTTCTGTAVNVLDNSASNVPIGINNNGMVPPTGNYQPMTLDFDANSAAPLVFTYADAGQITLHARYDIDPDVSIEYMFGGSNPFIVRPFAFSIESGDPDFTAADATGTAFVKASENFDVTVQAVVWQSGDDADNDGVPDSSVDLTDNAVTPNFGNETVAPTVDITRTLALPAGGDSGTLSGGTGVGSFGSINPGETTATLAFSEVGIIDLTATHISYLGTGSNITGTRENIGRFIPWRFAVSANTPTFADSCTGFTYMDQTFNYATAPLLTLTAINANDNTTLNYGGGNSGANGFVKFSSTPVLPRNFADGSAVSPSATFSGIDQGTNTLGDENDFNGEITLTLENGTNGDVFLYARNNPEAPFDADVDITFFGSGLTDTDGVCYDDNGTPGRCNTNDGDTADGFPINMVGDTEQRFGRLVIGTGAGSEALPVSVPLRTEYYEGAEFVRNDIDDCTVLTLADDLQLSNPETAGGTPQAATTTMNVNSGTSSITSGDAVFTAGESTLIFSAPGAGNTGYIDILGNLAAPGPEHLRYDWDNDDGLGDGPYDDNPTGRATFGVFEGPRTFIYIREPW